MASGFSTFGNWDTTTAGANTAGFFYFQVAQPVAAVWQAAKVSARTLSALALARLRSSWVCEPRELAAQIVPDVPRARRTVVPRGVVSWVRAGTQRPLRARRA